MTTALLLTATAAGLLGLAFWWIRRCNMAVDPAAVRAAALARTAPACDIGQQLLMASATNPGADGGPGAAGGASGETAGRKAAKPKRRKVSAPSRRAFLRNAMAISWLGVLGGFGGATLAYLWPSLRGGFGAQIDVDSEEAILEYIRENAEPYAYPAGRMYLVEYDPALDADGQYAELTDGASVMALYQVCVHLGCKVPWCQSSQWFECPCHGSRYNRWGEYRGGPAARGLDRFALTVEDGRVIVDTSQVIEGPSRQAIALDQPPEGPSCLGG
jgi:cytochrome b6-f complex iron-sulfur subunit